MDKYILTGLSRAGNRVTLAKCDSLAEAHRQWNAYRATRGVRRYDDIEIQYP